VAKGFRETYEVRKLDWMASDNVDLANKRYGIGFSETDGTRHCRVGGLCLAGCRYSQDMCQVRKVDQTRELGRFYEAL
jgi:hypothetical protein